MFAFEEGEIERFLSRHGFSLKDHSGKPELKDRYFRNSKGVIVGRLTVLELLPPVSRSDAIGAYCTCVECSMFNSLICHESLLA